MIGLVIVTQGGLAKEFRAALEHVVGAQEHLETISIGTDDDMEERCVSIRSAISLDLSRFDSGSGTRLSCFSFKCDWAFSSQC